MQIARREIHWLVKDAMGPAPKAAQKGFSFASSQVQLIRTDSIREELSRFGLSPAHLSSLSEFLSAGPPSASFLFVPLEREVDLSFALTRLALSKRMLHVAIQKPSVEHEVLAADNSFWTRNGCGVLPFGADATDVERALLNINHPYREASAYCVNADRAVDIESGNSVSGGRHAERVVTVTWAVDSLEATADVASELDRIAEVLPPGTRLKDQPSPMNSLGIGTGALSAGSLLVRITTRWDSLGWIIREGDEKGLSLHHLATTGGRSYIGLKKHPCDPTLDDLGPKFDPAREVRRLVATEYGRNELPGHKGPEGTHEHLVAEIDGWRVVATKPGFKDADDFLVRIESPTEQRELFVEGKPDFGAIFRESMWSAHCPTSGLEWLDAVWHVWAADVDLAAFIPSVHNRLPPCSYADKLEYPRGIFLWILALLFVEEDTNYRFFYHRLRGKPAYRKQGRDMPMNALLTVAANPINVDEPGSLPAGAVVGKLVRRPQTFQGPNHLRTWFSEHVLGDN